MFKHSVIRTQHFLQLNQVKVYNAAGIVIAKVGLHSEPSSCEQPSKCVSPQSPTEGCGVIPVEGRSMCTDPDPGGPTLIAPSSAGTSFCNPLD